MSTTIMNTGKNPNEKLPETLGFLNDEIHTGYMAGIFALVSNVNNIKKTIFDHISKYLFPVAFAFKLIDWFLYAWKYSQASNKNLGKTSNILNRTIATILIGLAVFGAAILKVTAAPIIFIAAIGLDTGVSLGKGIYSAVKIARSKDAEEKALHKAKLKENAIKTGLGILLIGAVVLGMIFAPHIAIAISATFVLATVVTLVAVGIYALVQRVRANRALKAAKKEENDLIEQNKLENKNEKKLESKQETQPQLNIEKNPSLATKPLLQPQFEAFQISKSKYLGFFDNRIKLMKPIANDSVYDVELKQLQQAINEHRGELNTEINKDKDKFIEKYIWSEGSKRQNKKNALDFLSKFINQFDNMIANKSITIAEHPFDYDNINDLIDKVDVFITTHYPQAYQSFFKDIGGVEALFKQAYKLLLAQAKYGMKKAPESEEVLRVA